MHKLLLFRGLLTLLLGLSGLVVAHASHVRGGDIYYATIASTTAGVPRYHVVVRQFIDTSPGAGNAYPTINLTASRVGSCSSIAPNGFTVTVPLAQSLSGPPLPCTTSAGTYSIHSFTVDLDLPLPLGPWSLSVLTENQNTPSRINALDAFLDNSLTKNKPDTSPQFESVLQPTISVGPTAPPHSFSAFDLDNDSLRYELMLPPGSSTTGCPQPIASGSFPPSFTLNATTGALLPVAAPTPTPSQGYATLIVRVSEYRKLNGQWQLIGFVMRDTLYLLYTTTNQAPTFTSLSLNSGPAQSPSLPIAAYPGQTLHLILSATDPDPGQLLRFASEAPNVVPGLTLTSLTATQTRLDWTLPVGTRPGRYAIAVAVLDNGCPYNASEERTLVFDVTNQALATRSTSKTPTTAFPLPFYDQVQFQATAGQAITIVDALGRVVAYLTSAADGRVVWQPATTLPAGLYLARGADGRVLARLLRAAN